MMPENVPTSEYDPINTPPSKKPREGWAEACQDMAQHGNDQLLDEPTATKWESKEWDW